MASCYARPMSEPEVPKRLLVVEDEAHLAAGLKLNLELDGYNVDVAANARQAAEKLIRVDRYDAIVLDVMLPDVNGFELCQRLRDAGNFVPVIMLTARSSPDDRVRGLEAGADDYMVKPFELAELQSELARCAPLTRCWLVRKNLREHPQRRAYLLFVELPGMDDEDRYELCRSLERTLGLPGPVLALWALSECLAARGFELIDCQVPTRHLASLGAEAWPRRRYLARLAANATAPSAHTSWADWVAPPP